MQKLAFVDLDDTLFQTRGKCPDLEGCEPASVNGEGEPDGFMLPPQQLIWRWLSDWEVIPVTGRTESAFGRVLLPFGSLKVLHHGAVIRGADGGLTELWRERIRPSLRAVQPSLKETWRQVTGCLPEGFRARLHTVEELATYVSVKSDGAPSELAAWIESFGPVPPELVPQVSGRNAAFLARACSKGIAVGRIIEARKKSSRVVSFGLGDAVGDVSFLRHCDFYALRPGSQIDAALALPNPEPKVGFAGTYAPGDVRFLLTPAQVELTEIPEKERLIQAGARHYSEMLSPELPPSPEYLDCFHRLTERYAPRMAGEITLLSRDIDRTVFGPITLVSLARAGTPVGVLLARALRRMPGSRDVLHASLSIVLDRGLDFAALRWLLRAAARPAEGFVFVDGWTAKGSIRRELTRSLARWNAQEPEQLADALTVLADPGGVAERAATLDDYPVPSGLLGAVVSGLISRTVLPSGRAPEALHQTVIQEDLRPFDRSQWFIERIEKEMPGTTPTSLPQAAARSARKEAVAAFLGRLESELGPRAKTHVKPGCAEATRALLRRSSERLLLKDAAHEDVEHLILLAKERGIEVREAHDMPYLAAAVIRGASHAAG